MLEIMQAFRNTRMIDKRPLGDQKSIFNKFSQMYTPSISDWFKEINFWELWFKLITIMVALKWAWKLYNYYYRRIVKKEIKNILISKFQAERISKVEMEEIRDEKKITRDERRW
ncbi:unnamed protein product [Meloidogyne enterolobii]